MNMNDDSEFYSKQPWYVKLWRNKTLLRIPFEAVEIWAKERFWKEDRDFIQYNDETGNFDEFPRMTFEQCYSVAQGLADLRRKHLYHWEDLQHGMNDSDH